MIKYQHFCNPFPDDGCGFQFHPDFDHLKTCPKCNKPRGKSFAPIPLMDYTGYNAGLGLTIKSKRHYDDMIKRTGKVPIGNDKPESVVKKRKSDYSKVKEEALKGLSEGRFK